MAKDIHQLPGDFMEAQRGIPEKAQKELREMDLLIAKCFNSPNGKKVLAWLVESTINQPVLLVSEGLGGIGTGFKREGQNDLVRLIQKRMKRANA